MRALRGMLDDRGGFDRLGYDLLWLLPLWASSSFGARPRRCLWLLESANGLFVSSDVRHVLLVSVKFTDFIAEQKSLQFLTRELRLPVRGLIMSFKGNTVRLDMVVQSSEVHYRADLVLASLNHGHEWYESFSRSVLSLVVGHERSLIDVQLQLLLVLSAGVFCGRVLPYHISQDIWTHAFPPFP
ncbi:hypothetical protein M514_08800 [Trichuris suis]|uniref:Uncharacterized protein n=1 Tax=Trichuris suis TaxID=68888 RepID=A0A085NJ93_9BILA|nr:hypothetical protein M514_08800 [Trichuris suis]